MSNEVKMAKSNIQVTVVPATFKGENWWMAEFYTGDRNNMFTRYARTPSKALGFVLRDLGDRLLTGKDKFPEWESANRVEIVEEGDGA